MKCFILTAKGQKKYPSLRGWGSLYLSLEMQGTPEAPEALALEMPCKILIFFLKINLNIKFVAFPMKTSIKKLSGFR